MKVFTKGLIITILSAILGLGLYLYSHFYSERYFKENLEVTQDFLKLQLKVNRLKLEILKSSSFLYYDYDGINHAIQETDRIIENIEKLLKGFGDDGKHVYLKVKSLESDFELYKHKVERYLTINSAIKSSIIIVPFAQIRASKLFVKDPKILLFLMQIYDDIFISKNAMDGTFLPQIREKIRELRKLKKRYPKRSEEYKFLESINQHLVRYNLSFPVYKNMLRDLLDDTLDNKIIENIEAFQSESKEEITVINRNTTILLILYIIALIFILFLIKVAASENRYLKELKETHEKLIYLDTLTGLKSMKAFNNDLENGEFRHPSLILININKFKHINEFYGTDIGDSVLLQVGLKIKTLVRNRGYEVYRLGGDDFGILFENLEKDYGLKKVVEYINSELENFTCSVNSIMIEPRFSIGASSNRQRLFETADMALKSAKKLSRNNYLIYSKDIDKREEIQNNTKTIKNISSALKNDRLKAYYQPIFNLETGKIEKYEALARIELEDGTLLKPYDFMSSAMEAKLSGDITICILKQVIEMAKISDYEFSMNISSSDIEFYKDREAIIDILKNNMDITDRIIFEILETEDIHDYDLIDEFIKNIKSLGCMIAIDDFGTGYSNFEKILKLDVDIIKVDGGLIKNIDKDRNSKLITITILNFAKYANCKTVAEFVYSKSLHDEVKRLNFDYAQGYYIGKPSPEIIRVV